MAREYKLKYGKPLRRVNVVLTEDAVIGLDTLAGSLGCSRSELLNRIGHGQLKVSSVGKQMRRSQVTLESGAIG